MELLGPLRLLPLLVSGVGWWLGRGAKHNVGFKLRDLLRVDKHVVGRHIDWRLARIEADLTLLIEE